MIIYTVYTYIIMLYIHTYSKVDYTWVFLSTLNHSLLVVYQHFKYLVSIV